MDYKSDENAQIVYSALAVDELFHVQVSPVNLYSIVIYFHLDLTVQKGCDIFDIVFHIFILIMQAFWSGWIKISPRII